MLECSMNRCYGYVDECLEVSKVCTFGSPQPLAMHTTSDLT